MRFRPRQSYRAGFVVPGGEDDASALVGTAVGQPRALLPEGHVAPLDEVLGDGFALLAVDVEQPALPEGELWEALSPRPLRVLLGDRFPEAGDGAWTTIADFDGGVRRALSRARGAYVLVRPDRFVAAVFTPGRVTAVERALRAAWGEPSAVAAARSE